MAIRDADLNSAATMQQEISPVSGKESQPADARKARLAQELRANLLKRKQQARSRRMGEADRRPEGIGQAAEGRKDDRQG